MTNTNLPSTWTRQKMSSSLLLILLCYLPKTKAGSLFASCLDSSVLDSNDNLYASLVSFSGSIPNNETFCCSENSPGGCSSLPCLYSHYNSCWCNTIGEGIFCVTHSWEDKSLPAELCGGIAGDISTVNATVGTCPSNGAIRNILTGSTKTTPIFTWMCCYNDNCTVPTNTSVTFTPPLSSLGPYTIGTNCTMGQYSMICFSDNDGWTCTGDISANFDTTYPIKSCIIQVNINETIPNSNRLDNTPLIVGTTVGGATLVGGGLVIRYCWKKRQEKKEVNNSQVVAVAENEGSLPVSNAKEERINFETQREIEEHRHREQELQNRQRQLENQIRELQRQLQEQQQSHEQEVGVHLEALEKSGEWHKRQNQELSDEIARLKKFLGQEVEIELRNLSSQTTAQVQLSGWEGYLG